MRNVNMKQFSEATGYPYDFVRKLAKHHGSWKSLVEHVKQHKCINPLFGFEGFITYDQCFDFHKKHQPSVQSILRNRDDIFLNNFVDRVIGFQKIHSGFHVDIGVGDSRDLLSQASSRYKQWYSRPVWYILKDVGNKLNTMLEN